LGSKKKAISPIIAELILILITVVMGVFLYGFVSGYTGGFSGIIAEPPPNIQFISSSFHNGKLANFTFLIYNAGATAVTIQRESAVINLNSMQSVSGNVSGVSQTGLTIPPKKQRIINVTVPSSELISDNNYYIKFLTSSGYIIQSPIIFVQLIGQVYDFIPITITNSQNSPTPVPFQQMLQINIQNLNSELSQYGFNVINNDGSNVRFYLSSISPNDELYAWLESVDNGIATYWVKIPNGIKAHTSITVYMVVESPSTGFDGVFLGEAPQLSPRYGEYDNGQYVFDYYTNFSDANSLKGWDLNGTVTGFATFNKGLWLNVGEVYGYQLTLNRSYVGNYTVDALEIDPNATINYEYDYGSDNVYLGISFNKLSTSNYKLIPPGNSGGFQEAMTYLPTFTEYLSTTNATSNKVPAPLVQTNVPITSPAVFSLGFSGSTVFSQINYSYTLIYKNSNATGPNYPGITALAVSYPYLVHVYWFRIRATPPNNVIPSVIFGEPQST